MAPVAARRLRGAWHALTATLPVDRDDARALLLASHRVNLVVDCGANSGQYARRVRAKGYCGRIVSFEPGERAFADLARAAGTDPHWTCHRLALGASTGAITLNVAAETTLSSLLAPAVAPEIDFGVAAVTRESVAMARLDDVLPGLIDEKDSVHLKLDVQGFEKEILAGAETILRRVSTLECELPVLAIYRGQPSLGELLAFLETHGFSAVRIDPNYIDPRTGYCVDVDALFRRSCPPRESE